MVWLRSHSRVPNICLHFPFCQDTAQSHNTALTGSVSWVDDQRRLHVLHNGGSERNASLQNARSACELAPSSYPVHGNVCTCTVWQWQRQRQGQGHHECIVKGRLTRWVDSACHPSVQDICCRLKQSNTFKSSLSIPTTTIVAAWVGLLAASVCVCVCVCLSAV